MKKIYYKLNEESAETDTLYIDLPEYFGCAWISTTGGDPTTDEDAEGAEGEAFNEQIAEIIRTAEPEECTAEDYAYIIDRARIWGIYTPKKLWYAVQTPQDAENGEWGNGSFDWDEAVKMAKALCDDSRIAEIDGAYDEEGKEHADPIYVAEYFNGEDF